MRLLFLVLVFTCLGGCAIEPSSRAVVDVYRFFRADQSPVKVTTGLDPAFRYLRVQVGRRELFVALGYVEQHADGPIEVWYSPTREVLRLRDGRLIGASMSFGADWLSVSFANLPRWNEIGDETFFERNRDVSPGYRYGIKEKMFIRRVPAPADSNLQLLPAASLIWFEEQAVNGDLPAARYGVDMSQASPQVIYAEQCLSPETCFSWQRWQPEKASRR